MAIYIICSGCGNMYSVNKKECPKCGFKNNINKKYIVRAQVKGKRTSQVVYNSLDLAKQLEAKFKTQLLENKFFEKPKQMTFDEAVSQYNLLFPSKTTDKEYQRYLLHLKPFFGNKQISDITTYDIQHFISQQTSSYSPKTIHNIYNIIHRTFNFCLRYDFLQKNPCKNIKLPKINNLVTNFMSAPQVAILIETLDKDKNKLSANLIKFLLFTGIRRGEAFKLCWDQVNMVNGEIKLLDPKSGKDKILPLNSLALEVLKNQDKISELVFPQPDGTMRSSIRAYFDRILKIASLPHFRVHDLRHTYASLLAASGQVDIYTLQHLLTHSSIQMTQRYAHLIDSSLRKGSQVLSELLKKD